MKHTINMAIVIPMRYVWKYKHHIAEHWHTIVSVIGNAITAGSCVPISIEIWCNTKSFWLLANCQILTGSWQQGIMPTTAKLTFWKQAYVNLTTLWLWGLKQFAIVNDGWASEDVAWLPSSDMQYVVCIFGVEYIRSCDGWLLQFAR